MFYLIILIAVAIAITVIADSKNTDKPKNKKTKGLSPEEATSKKFYRAKSRFFTKSEYMFFQELEKQNNGKYHIFSKVRLEDIVEIMPGMDRSVAFGKRNSIKSRHIDFILVSKETGKVVKAIELDGKSHGSYKQKKSDDKKDLICRQAGIGLIRVRVGESFENRIGSLINN